MQRGPEQALVDEYQKRLPWKTNIIEIDMKKPAGTAAERKKREAERLLAAVPDGAALVVLDENGKNFKSREFAGKIDNWQMAGYSHVAFVIGANDVTNPAARDDPNSPIFGMPILDVDKAATCLFIKRSMGSGYAGIDNTLFFNDNTMMLLDDAKNMVENIAKSL